MQLLKIAYAAILGFLAACAVNRNSPSDRELIQDAVLRDLSKSQL